MALISLTQTPPSGGIAGLLGGIIGAVFGAYILVEIGMRLWPSGESEAEDVSKEPA